MRNRWYSPQLGQFMSHDPLEYIDSYDLYAFAKLDPINFWDPWGLSGGNLAGTNGTGNSPSGKGRPPSGKRRGGVGGAPNLSPGRTSGCDKACQDKIPDFTSLKPGSPASSMPEKVRIDRELLEQLENVQNPDYEVSGEIHRAPDGLLFPIIIHRELQEELNPDLQKNHSLPPPDVRAVIAALMPNRDLLFPLGTPVAYFHTHPGDSNINGADAYHTINSAVISVIVGADDTSIYVPTDRSNHDLEKIRENVRNGYPYFDGMIVSGSVEGQVYSVLRYRRAPIPKITRFQGPRGSGVMEQK